MAQRISLKTTYEAGKVISPFYTGGSVALSEDGRILATSAGEDAILTDLTSGERLAQIDGDGEAITSLCLTPSASHIIICSRSLSMRIYSLDRTSSDHHITVELSRTLKPHASPVITSAIDRTGTLVATGAADGIIKVWDIRAGYTTHTFHGHSGVISALHFFEVSVALPVKDTNSANRKSKKRKKSEVDGDEEQQNDDPASGYRLASGSEDGQVRIWNLQRRKCAAVLESHGSVVRALDFDLKENVLLSGSRDRTVILWNASTWKIRNTIPVTESVEAAGFIADTQLIYTGGEHDQVRLWWSRTGKEATEDQGHATSPAEDTPTITDIIYHKTLPFLVSIHSTQNFRIYSLQGLQEAEAGSMLTALPVKRQISGNHDEIIDLAYVGLDQSLLAVATNLEEIRILSLQESAGQSDSSKSLSDGTYFGADVGVLKGHEDIIICLDVDWSGCWLATGAKDNTACLWRIDSSTRTFTQYATFTGHAESLGAVALPKTRPAVDSRAYTHPLDHPPPFLITGSQDKTIKRWDTSTLQSANTKAPRATYTRKAHDKDINALDINHNSQLLASASQDRTVKIWSLEDGEAIGILRGHKRGVWSVKFSPRDTVSISSESGGVASRARGYVLTGSGDKTVKIWSLADYSCVRTFEGHTNTVLKVLWLNPPDKDLSQVGETNGAGQDDEDDANDNDDDADEAPVRFKAVTNTRQRPPHIASAGGDGLVKVWEATTGEVTCTLDNHTDRVWALAQPHSPPLPSSPPSGSSSSADQPTSKLFSPSSSTNTTTLISGGGDGVLTFWHDTTLSTTHTLALASTARIEQDQRLQNLIRSQSYHEAITLALALDHPARLLALFTAVATQFPAEEGSVTGIKAVDDVIAGLGDEALWRLLGRLREWNASAKTAWVAQRVLGCVLKRVEAGRIVSLRAPRMRVGMAAGAGDASGVMANAEMGAAGGIRRKMAGAGSGNIKDVLEGLRVYTERHYRRIEDLMDESHLVEYTLREMDEVLGGGSSITTNGVNSVNGHAGDVAMIG